MGHLSRSRLVFQHLSFALYSLINLAQIILAYVLLLSIGHQVQNLLINLIFELSPKSQHGRLVPDLADHLELKLVLGPCDGVCVEGIDRVHFLGKQRILPKRLRNLIKHIKSGTAQH